MASISSVSSQLNAQHQLQQTAKKESDLLSKLSSGKKVESGKDDTTALTKIASLEAAIRGNAVGTASASQASSTINVAAGGLSQVLSQLQTLRSTAVQAADSALSATDRSNLTAQASNTLSSINQVANSVQADGNKLLNGSFTDKAVQVGANVGDSMTVSISGARTTDLGVNNVDLSTPDGASSAIAAADSAINQVTTQMANLGSTQNRLETAASNNQSASESLRDSQSKLQDLDLSQALSELKSLQVKKEAGAQISKLLQQSQKSSLKILT